MEGGPLSAYKFLRAGAVGPFSGIVWPQPTGGGPGVWVARDDGLSACASRHLPMWIHEELWEVDMDGGVRSVGHKLIAPRARLARRIDAWSPEVAGRFAEFCVGRAVQHAARATADEADVVARVLSDGSTAARGAVASDDAVIAAKASAGAAYIAAMIARRVSGPDAFDTERAQQADWLVRELGLA